MTPSPPEARQHDIQLIEDSLAGTQDIDAVHALDRLVAELRELQEAHQAAMRELERASDVRANRTRIIGNAHMILAASSEEPG